MTGKTMLAVTQSTYGEPGVLTVTEVPRPQPLPTEVLVRVVAAGVNPVDWQTRRGDAVTPLTFPLIPGWDISGVVEEVGPGVTRWINGDEVYGMPWFPRSAGGYAQYVTAPARQLARKPSSMDHVHAAALPLAALTAWQVLVDTARLAEGHRVLITAAAGGVGHLAVQIAKHFGAEVVATARPARHAWLKELGANVVVDYTNGDIRTRTGTVDVVVDLIGSGATVPLAPLVRPGGLIVTDVDASSLAYVPAEDSRVRVVPFIVEPDGTALDKIADLVDAGALRVEVAKTYPLERAADAHTDSETHRTRGKLVLTVDDTTR